MILCPECSNGELIENIKKKLFSCSECGFKLPVKDGVVVFHPGKSGVHNGFKPTIFNDVLEIESNHFWIKVRKHFAGKMFKRYVRPGEKILEVGSGTGNIAGGLLKKGYKDISVADVHLNGLETTKRYDFKKRFQFDLAFPPFRNHFDVVALFDVLEHVDDDNMVTQNIHKMLKTGGKAIVTVPAHMWLWSKNDRICSHRRRYEVKQIRYLFEKNGFKIVKAHCFFVSILPLLYFRHIFYKDTGRVEDADYKKRFKVNPVLNYLLEKILKFESRILPLNFFNKGGSIILVGVKEDI